MNALCRECTSLSKEVLVTVSKQKFVIETYTCLSAIASQRINPAFLSHPCHMKTVVDSHVLHGYRMYMRREWPGTIQKTHFLSW